MQQVVALKITNIQVSNNNTRFWFLLAFILIAFYIISLKLVDTWFYYSISTFIEGLKNFQK